MYVSPNILVIYYLDGGQAKRKQVLPSTFVLILLHPTSLRKDVGISEWAKYLKIEAISVAEWH
jgi:hypothetical protein